MTAENLSRFFDYGSTRALYINTHIHTHTYKCVSAAYIAYVHYYMIEKQPQYNNRMNNINDDDDKLYILFYK